MPNTLIDAMERAIREVRQWPEKTVQIFHHNDSMADFGASLPRLRKQGFKSSASVWKSLSGRAEKGLRTGGQAPRFADFAAGSPLLPN